MTIPGERAECCAAEGAYAENSQAKGLEPDGPPESLTEAPKKQSPDLPRNEADAFCVDKPGAPGENLSGNETECAAGRTSSFLSPAEARWQNLKEEDYYERIKTDHSL